MGPHPLARCARNSSTQIRHGPVLFLAAPSGLIDDPRTSAPPAARVVDPGSDPRALGRSDAGTAATRASRTVAPFPGSRASVSRADRRTSTPERLSA